MNERDLLREENEQLRLKLAEALEALDAIRSGDVDALVVYKDEGEQVFTLQGAEHPYRVMVEAINEGAATLSDNGLILWGNAYLAELLQIPLENLLGTPMLSHFSPESRPIFEAVLDQNPLIKSKIEVDLNAKERGRVPVLVSISPLVNPTHSAHLCLILTDLTAQRRSLELAAAERMAVSIIQQAVEPVVVCDSQGRVVRASRSASDLVGSDPLAKSFEKAFPLRFEDAGEDLPSSTPNKPAGDHFSLPDVLNGTVIHGVEAALDCSRYDMNGKTRNLIVSAAPLYLTDNSQPWGCVITMTDMTERKRIEEEVSKYAWRLEQSNKDLQDFAFVASHDLQEPLRKFRAFSMTLKEKFSTCLQEEGLDYLNRMQSAEERMRKMIDELLTYSRVATKSQPFEQVDLNRIVSEVLTDLEVRLSQTRGKVEVEPLPVIDADPMQMRQLFQNILSNALKFHKKGVPPLVSVRVASPDQGKVEITIEDNGIGFSMEHLDLIFKPFQRLHGRSEYEGSGIGLAICRRIIERHNGQIIVSSAPGQGATLSSFCPCARKKRENRLILNQPPPASSAPATAASARSGRVN